MRRTNGRSGSSVERRRIAHDVERSLSAELVALALEGARFGGAASATAKRGRSAPTGVDDVEFLLSANPGEALRPLSRVASGGELSRIMLALKTLAAGDDHDATLIFDEVDTGIGGRGGRGRRPKKLRQLGRRRQVLCVTHLPVMAAFAQHHVGVMKKVVGGRTVSSARPLAPRIASPSWRACSVARASAARPRNTPSNCCARPRDVRAVRGRRHEPGHERGIDRNTAAG